MTDEADPIATRTRILDAAESLFARLGFDGASTARIARAAGVPKGLLFYYFPTKPDLLGSLIEERLGTDSIDPVPLTVHGDPVQTLLNVGDTVLSAHAASDVLREIIWHESHTRPDVSAALTRYRRALHELVECALRASLTVSADELALRAAADAWAATITARPLTAGSESRPHLHEPASLRAIARLLTAGLLVTAPGPATT
ncbi:MULTISPECIES: TetR/AcrR family transcriptional regulator [unclassified Microbacterium]|uniref:TetR/AcrR family transcriptional regulator n=1 Tax=unclassified Microbacterium TaxID=2609290 RepID=UPI0012FCB90C|nr:TetR/AcrR family transcriptional regulator [Microbacterium sp. MAH-37]MVQ42387.1 TetR family transcriptional regulator [Microbacterium sp. MAH-37]